MSNLTQILKSLLRIIFVKKLSYLWVLQATRSVNTGSLNQVCDYSLASSAKLLATRWNGEGFFSPPSCKVDETRYWPLKLLVFIPPPPPSKPHMHTCTHTIFWSSCTRLLSKLNGEKISFTHPHPGKTGGADTKWDTSAAGLYWWYESTGR
jgi:hypothetical protein